MDATSTDNYSDSDSGESWTLLERCPSCADDASIAESPVPREEEVLEKESSEKDEDTDGISIISDSDPENLTSCEHLNYCYSLPDITDHQSVESNFDENFPVIPNIPTSSKNVDESMSCEDDFLSADTGKLKTYVHKRNKKLSTVLNVILLGSVITAAGVAIGHMWGVKDDCLMHSTSSVNKILSNLYKLQEENALLRTKIRELTNALQVQQRKSDIDKIVHVKYPRCKKIFEESLDNKDAVKYTKCVDFNIENILDHSYEQEEFSSDMNRLKAFYKQNKSWLDNEISRRLKEENIYAKKPKEILKSIQIDTENNKNDVKDVNQKSQLHQSMKSISDKTVDITNLTIENEKNVKEVEGKMEDNKISYADSLKSSTITKSSQEKKKIKIEKSNDKRRNTIPHKKEKRDIVDYEASSSDVEATKDGRYMGHRHKPDLKKYDRQKAYKKQKRKNKYEQWEMNRGYIKDHDEFIPIAYNNYISNKRKGHNDKDYGRQNAKEQLPEIERKKYASQYSVNNGYNTHDKDNDNEKRGDDYDSQPNWLEMRAELRSEARKKLNQKLLGKEGIDSARWYFRRMQRRDQYRSKGDNLTRRKYPKQHPNYKAKHTN